MTQANTTVWTEEWTLHRVVKAGLAYLNSVASGMFRAGSSGVARKREEGTPRDGPGVGAVRAPRRARHR